MLRRDKMKILIASDFFSPTINGVVTSIINLQKELEAHGHEVKILTLRRGKNYGYEECVYVIPSISAWPVLSWCQNDAVPRNFRTAGYYGMETGCDSYKQRVLYLFPGSAHFSQAGCIPIVHTYHTVYEDYVHYFSPNEVIGKGLVRKLSHNLMARVDSIVVPTQKVKEPGWL